MRVFGVLCVVGLLLFTKLGHYALWDDEANTALTGKAIIKTGDTSASVDGRNFLMYRQGTELEELKNRYLPPLSSCLAALSFLFLEPSACSARLPFAVIGFMGIAFFLMLIWRLNLPSPFLMVFVILLLSNVSLYLFLRNCRYYSPVLAFTVFSIAIYQGKSGSRMQLLGLSLSGFFLAAAQYLNYAALVFALVLDYVLYRRFSLALSVRKWGLLLASQVIMVGALLTIFNPIGKKVVTAQNGNWVADKLQLLWWNFRDLDACQFGSLPILLLGFLFVSRGPYKEYIKRLGIGCIAYISVITILSPQPVQTTSVADVRYLASLIPILIALESLILCSVFQFKPKFALLCAALLSFSNILSLDFMTQRALKFPIYSFFREMLKTPSDPYSETADWIRQNISPGSSIWVLPEHMAYPLMFHAPESVYAWQLDAHQRKEGQFSALSPIHFKGVAMPEYIIVFGPVVVEVREMLKQWKMEGVNFESISMIDVFWKDLYRPELFWRSSEPIVMINKEEQGVYVFKRARGVKSL